MNRKANRKPPNSQREGREGGEKAEDSGESKRCAREARSAAERGLETSGTRPVQAGTEEAVLTSSSPPIYLTSSASQSELCPPPFICWSPNPKTSECDLIRKLGLCRCHWLR